MNAIPKWATTPLGRFSPQIPEPKLIVRRRPKEKLLTPTPCETILVKALALAGQPIFAGAIADSIHASPQRRRDMHGYLKKLVNKGYVSITEYVSGNGLRGPPRPRFKLTEKAEAWLKAT